MSTNFSITNDNVKKKSKIVNYALNLKDIYRKDVKASRHKYFDQLIQLYIDRKLENKRTLQKGIDALIKGDKKVLKIPFRNIKTLSQRPVLSRVKKLNTTII